MSGGNISENIACIVLGFSKYLLLFVWVKSVLGKKVADKTLKKLPTSTIDYFQFGLEFHACAQEHMQRALYDKFLRRPT